jgi:hypothetical protein
MIKTLHNFFAQDRPDLSKVEAEVVIDLAFALLLSFDPHDQATWWVADKAALVFKSSRRPGRSTEPRRLQSRDAVLGRASAKYLSQALGVLGHPQRFDERRHINKAAAIMLLGDVLAVILDVQSSPHAGILGGVIFRRNLENLELMQRVAVRHLQNLSKPFSGKKAGRPRIGSSKVTPMPLNQTESIRGAAWRIMDKNKNQNSTSDDVAREENRLMRRTYRARLKMR